MFRLSKDKQPAQSKCYDVHALDANFDVLAEILSSESLLLRSAWRLLPSLLVIVFFVMGSQETVAEPEDSNSGSPESAPSQDKAKTKIPYEGALPPATPPDGEHGAAQKPVAGWVESASKVLYQRPSPKGPDPIPLEEPKAIFVTGDAPVIQALPGALVFAEKIPSYVRSTMPAEGPFSNSIQTVSGEIQLAAVDRTLNDTKKSEDWMVMKASFTDTKGANWRVEQVLLAPLSSTPVTEPWFGGVAIDVPYHGDTGNGTAAVPRVNCALCSWAWADIYKDDRRVASSALVHVMVTSDTRDDAGDFRYYDYDSTNRPVREVHLVVPPREYLPTPGGFLHVMWENADVVRGTPQEVTSMANEIAEYVPTIELSAVPYLKWDQKEIAVRTGQKYRLIVHNTDPSSFHQFSLHPKPESGGHHDEESMRHSHGGTAGRTGGLWKPEKASDAQEGQADSASPPAPKKVFLPLPQGSTWATMVTFDKAGEYEFMCPVGNHYRRGMSGKFVANDQNMTGSRQ